jgi:hypothetical protein
MMQSVSLFNVPAGDGRFSRQSKRTFDPNDVCPQAPGQALRHPDFIRTQIFKTFTNLQ